jgi:sugar phosphate isomerase/epimerase
MNRSVGFGRRYSPVRVGRRQFLGSTAGAAVAVALSTSTEAIEPFERKRPSHLKLSLAAYSYRSYLEGQQKSMDLFDFINLAADLAVDAVELTSYYFPDDVDNDYLHRLRRHAFLQGLDVSGTAVMNDFCLPPGAEADASLEHLRTWIDRASELSAPFVRILSGNWIQGTPDEELEKRVIARINQLLPHARQRGVMLALENHGGGVTTTPENLLRIVKSIKGDGFGVNLDTGNFHGLDPYAELAEVAPYAVNVQVKTEIRRRGKSKEYADLAKVIGVLRQARYSGYVVLEYNAAEDAKQVVPRYVKQLRELIS